MTEEARKRIKMKYEIAEELGLLDKVEQYGWKSLTSRESGRIGGVLSRRQWKQKTEKLKATKDGKE